MPAGPSFGGLAFRDQIEFFRKKVNVPTKVWTDLWEGEHSHGFMVAGAAKEELLADLRAAVDKVIAQGVTLEQFRKDFDQIVAKHGWAYNGGRNWRTRVIYDTNLRQSYHAGRYKQRMEIRDRRPFWTYRHSDGVAHPRPEHKAWNGLTLPWDHPWWSTHHPQNGWGCQCDIDTSKTGPADVDVDVDKHIRDRWAEMQKSGEVKANAPAPVGEHQVTVGTRGPSPRTATTPRGVDPGFGYSPGEAAWGRNVAQQTIDQGAGGVLEAPVGTVPEGAPAPKPAAPAAPAPAPAPGPAPVDIAPPAPAAAPEPVTAPVDSPAVERKPTWAEIPGNKPADYGRPARVPLDEPQAELGPAAQSPADLEPLFEAALGSDQAIFVDPIGQRVLLDRTIPDHIAATVKRLDGRERYFPLIRETIERPFEVWVSFAREETTGRYAIRRRYVKAFTVSGYALALVTECVNGVWVGVTAFRGDSKANSARSGHLIYGRPLE